MNVDINIISQLRERTGAGVADCQKALEEAKGDMRIAVEVLRKKGAVKAARKSGRVTQEGAIAIKKEGGKIAVVALSCETDFVARNQDFIKAADEFVQRLLANGEAKFRAWAEDKIKNELIIKIGENIQLTDFTVISGEVLGKYLHSDKKAAGVVILSAGDEELANNLAMQVVAMAPKYLESKQIPSEELEKEKEIYRAQLEQAGKPKNLWDKIISGKIDKYYKEVCLLNQVYIKDDSKRVGDLLKEAGEGVEVREFRRFAV